MINQFRWKATRKRKKKMKAIETGTILLGLGMVLTAILGFAGVEPKVLSGLKPKIGQTTTTPTVKTLDLPTMGSEIREKKSILKMDVNLNRTIFINGVVGQNVVAQAARLRHLDKVSKAPIYVILDSPGGSVLDGAVFISAMEAAESPVITICHRMCASMAAMILEYGTKRYAFDRSIIMFHQASAGVDGELGKMQSMLKFLSNYIATFEQHVAYRMGISLQDYRARMYNEYWMDSATALKHRAIDSIVSVNLDRGEILDLLQAEDIKKSNNDGNRVKPIKTLTW